MSLLEGTRAQLIVNFWSFYYQMATKYHGNKVYKTQINAIKINIIIFSVLRHNLTVFSNKRHIF